MKRVLLSLLLLCISTGNLFSQNIIGEESAPVLRDLQVLSALFPRPEGSANESSAREFVISRIEQLGLDYSLVEYNKLETLHSFSAGVETTIPGKIKDELLFVIPLDNSGNAGKQNSGSIAIALALHLLEKYASVRPPLGLHFVFLGGEHGSNGFALTGTRNFLADYFPDKPVAVLYLDIPALSDTVEMRVSGRNISAPFWFIRRCDNALEQAGLYSRLMNNEIHVHRLGLSGDNSLINAYLSEEIPGIHLGTGKPAPAADTNDLIQKMIIFLDNFIRENSGGFISEWDKNYLYFQSRFFSYLVSETVYIVTILIFFCFILIYPLISRNSFMRHIKTLGYNGNYILFYLLGSVIVCLAVKLLTDLLIILRGTTAVIRDFPVFLFVFQFLAIVFLLYAMMRWIIPGPQNGTFYNGFALMLLLADILFTGFIDISFTYIFIWAFFWAFLSTTAKSATAKRIFFLLSPLLIINSFIDFLSIHSDSLRNEIFRNLFPGVFFWAFIILPFILLFFRLKMLSPKTHMRRRRIIVSLFSAAILTCAVLVLALRPKALNAEINEFIQTGSGTRLVILKDEYPLVKKDIPSFFTRQNRYSYIFEEDYPFSGLVIEKTEARFLSRRKITFTINAPDHPEKINVVLTTKNNILIYNSAYPFSINPKTNSARIIIGINPPVPLVFDIVVPEDFNGTADFRVQYTKNPLGDGIKIPGYTLKHKIEIKSVLEL